MNTITLAYCHVCEAVGSFCKRVGRGIEYFVTTTSYAKASAELARQGHQAEAKALMMELKSYKENYQFDPKVILAIFLALSIVIGDDQGRGILDKKKKRKEEIVYNEKTNLNYGPNRLVIQSSIC